MGPGEGRREGRGQKTAVAKLGGGELWTVGARCDRCLGPSPSPSGYVGLGEHKATLQTLASPSGSCPDSLHLVAGRGPQGLGKAAPALFTASPQTHSHTSYLPGRQPCQPGQGAALMPDPSDRGGQSWVRRGKQTFWGSCGHRKRKELGGGICWEAPCPTPCASYCYPGWLGGTRLGLRGNSEKF